jgi:outer membrane protein assembly factor BamB
MRTSAFASIVGYAFIAAAFHSTTLRAQDWPQWRGPHRDGKTTAPFAVPATWPATLTKKWDISVGSGVANPSFVSDRLYVVAREGENEVVRCLNAMTGDEIWKASYASAEPTGFGAGNGRFIGPRSSPTVSNGNVIILSANGLLSVYDATTGRPKWTKDEFVAKVPTFYTSSSPLVVDGLCIAQLGAGSGDGLGALVAYDLSTGQEKWRVPEGSPSYASPIAMTIDGMKVVVALSETQLVAVNVANGEVVWKLPLRQNRYNSSSPIADGQMLIIGGPGTRGLTAFKMTRQGDQLKEEEAWTYNDNQLIFNTPVLRDGALFGYNTRDEIFAVKPDHTTGWAVSIVPPSAATSQFLLSESQTAFAQPQPPGRGGGNDQRRGGGQQRGRGQQRGGGRNVGGGERPGYGSVVDAGSVMFSLCPGGDLVVFAPNANEYQELARYKVSTDGDVYSHPIVSGNRIYIKDRDSVALFTVE